jgi:hypothetical protein
MRMFPAGYAFTVRVLTSKFAGEVAALKAHRGSCALAYTPLKSILVLFGAVPVKAIYRG